MLFNGCATTPQIGVRKGFEERTVTRVAIAPVYSTSRFGLDEARWRRLEQQVVQTMTAELEARGVEVLGPNALRDGLERKRAWPQFEDLLDFTQGLDNRFEPSLYAPATSEVVALRELAADELLEVSALLFAEIVYHSTGECKVDATEHNRFAIVVNRDGSPHDGSTPGPCVVTHIQAKLVDAPTASTMWHNRVLRELRGADLTPEDANENLVQTARTLAGGPHGLAPFAPTAPR